MKTKFSTKWISSKQPRKQRKYLANAPLHLKRKLLAVNLSKALRIKHEIRNIEIRKGDVVKIMRGKFKGKSGKVTEIKTKMLKIYIEGIQIKKKDGSNVNIPMRPSNLQITELDTSDKKRFRKSVKEGKKTEKKIKSETPKKEDSEELNKNKEQNESS